MLDSANASRSSSKIIRPKKVRGKSTPFGVALRKLIGPVFSVKGDGGCKRMKNITWVTLRNRHGRRFEERYQLPYSYVNAHEAGRPGLKVSSLHGFETLLYFDIDTHKYGSAQDVIILCQIIRDLFPGMLPFICNDRGGSGWIVVDTSNTSPVEYNALVSRLEAFLRSVAKSMQLNVEFVECKGRVYAPTFDAKGRCLSVTGGDLLKTPPNLDYLTQPVVDASYLASGTFDPWVDPIADPHVKAAHTHVLDVPDPVKNAFTSSNDQCGSFKPKLVTEEVAARLSQLTVFVEARFHDRISAVGRRKITARQYAELLFAFAILPPNANGGNPYLRHAGFISAMVDSGIFETKFRHEKYKVIRDFLSSKGGITWEDHVHRPGRMGESGVACKWRLNPELLLDVRTVLGLESFDNKQDYTLATTSGCYSVEYTSQHRVPTMIQLAQVLSAQEEWTQKRLEEIFSQVAA